MKDKSIVGDLINFRGLVYQPLNENGVFFLFGKIAGDLNMYAEEVRDEFPNCVARRFTGRGWKRVFLQFEFKSSDFRAHSYDPNQCDLIVCWENDWRDCPLEVLELREILRDLPNIPIIRPMEVGQEEYSLENHFQKYGEKTRILFESFHPLVKSVDDEIFHRLTWSGVAYYSPQRIFCYFDFLIKAIQLTVFTRGRDLNGVEKFGCEKGGQKWGRFTIQKEEDIPALNEILKESLKRIKEALKANENTGLYAVIREEEAPNDLTGAD